MIKGNIFNIQRFSLNDGPGIRTTVFLKGCNMRCFWCHNPESQDFQPQIMYFSNKCIGCEKCIKVCPNSAHQMLSGNKVFLREYCKQTRKCIKECNAQALVMTGEELSIDEVMLEVEKDDHFYKSSGGGVTFSGGEPLLQKEFLREALVKCKSKGFNTAVDTAGNVHWDIFEEIIPYTDLFLYDVKCIDNKKHEQATGLNNNFILDNLKKLSSAGVDIWIRIPVIPSFNDTIDEMEKIAAFLNNIIDIRRVELIPFHKFGKEKYIALGKDYKPDSLQYVSDEQMNSFVDIFKKMGLVAQRA